MRTNTKFGINSLKLTMYLKLNDIWPSDPYHENKQGFPDMDKMCGKLMGRKLSNTG